MAYSDKAHRDKVDKSSDTRVVKAMLIQGWYAVLTQTQTQTRETWVGLSLSDAESLCTSTEESTLKGTKRTYLGGAVVKSSNTFPYSWMRVDSCWGTKVSTSMQRMGDTNYYEVQRTTTVLSVSTSTGVIELL